MFALHERTRRQLLLVGFFLFCVMPTLVTLSWCVAVHLPGAKVTHADPPAPGKLESPAQPSPPARPAAANFDSLEAEQQRLGRALGVKVFLEGVTRPGPGMVQYKGLDLVDPETGRRMLRCGWLEVIQEHSGAGQGQAPQVKLRAVQTTVDADEMPQLAEVVRHIFRRRTGWPDVGATIACGEVFVHGTGVKQVLSDVQVAFLPRADGTQAELSFRLAGTPMPEPARLRLTRSRQVTPPAFGFVLTTGDSMLPCGLLAPGIPAFGELGPQSKFSGTIVANQTEHGWQGEITRSRLSGVDLDRLVKTHSPHRLSAMADVAITRARFSNGRLEEAEGALATGRGAISCSLLAAAELELGLMSYVELSRPSQLARLEQMAFTFSLNGRGITLKGCCQGAPAGTVLVDPGGPALTELSSEPRPVAALVRMLVPGDAFQLPATRQADRLARLLPLPQTAPPNVRIGTVP